MLATMDSSSVTTLFEIGMLFCFGISWPFAVMKTYKSKNIGGKSPIFLIFVFFGYISGIMFKVFGKLDFVIALYALNGLMVAADLALYYTYRARGLTGPASTPAR